MAFGCGVLDGRARCDLSWCCRSGPDKVRIWTNTLHHSNQIRPAVRPQQERQPAERENLVAGLSDPASPVAGVGAPPSQHLQWDFGSGLALLLARQVDTPLGAGLVCKLWWWGSISPAAALPQFVGCALRPPPPGFDRVRTSPRAADHIGMHWPRGAQCSGSLDGFVV